jgi:polar amino acid transport system substrate-binding protein
MDGKLVRLVTFFIGLLLVAFQAHGRSLSFVTAALPPIVSTDSSPGYMEELAREAFGRVGVDIRVSALPGERALINANNGLDDGDLLRIAGLEKVYPNLVRIPEKVMDFEFTAFTRSNAIHISGFADLKPYSVAYVTGWKYYENNVKEAHEITTVRGLPELFGLLNLGRTDVVLAERWQGLWAAHEAGVKVVPQTPPFSVSDMYIYLHKRHADLVPKVAEAIAEMKTDGTLQRIAEQTLRSVEVK